MGMIVTLYLISANVYNSVKAPDSRGFSYIEIWMIGTQIPILLALVEYGFILYLKKISKKFEDKNETLELGKPKEKLDDKIKKLDFATMIFSLIYFIIFATIYWIVASYWNTTEQLYISKKHSIPGAPGGIADDFRQLLYQCGALPLPPPCCILQHQGKTEILPVLPTTAPLTLELEPPILLIFLHFCIMLFHILYLYFILLIGQYIKDINNTDRNILDNFLQVVIYLALVANIYLVWNMGEKFLESELLYMKTILLV